MPFHTIHLDEPADYVIKVQGHLTDDYLDWFKGEALRILETGENGETVTVLTGRMIDQTALHGLLKHIRDMGLPLLLVDCLTAHPPQEDGNYSGDPA